MPTRPRRRSGCRPDIRALGPKTELEWVWGSYENEADHDIDCDPSMVEESMRVWREEIRKTDDALAAHPPMDELGADNRYSVRWNLAKLIGEYARYNGHADILRERIDGQTGEWERPTLVAADDPARVPLDDPLTASVILVARPARRRIDHPKPLGCKVHDQTGVSADINEPARCCQAGAAEWRSSASA